MVEVDRCNSCYQFVNLDFLFYFIVNHLQILAFFFDKVFGLLTDLSKLCPSGGFMWVLIGETNIPFCQRFGIWNSAFFF